MPPNIKDLVADIKESVDRFPREALVEILTYVFKEYVVEGPAPIAAAPPALRDDLEGMSFAEVIRSLQLRLDLPELSLFEVQGDRVTVKIGGRATPIELARQDPLPAAPLPPPPPAPMATPSAPSGITTASVSLPTPAAAAPRNAPSGAPGMTREEVPLVGGRAAPAPAPSQQAAAAKQGGSPAPAAPSDDAVDKTGRFGLLEID